MPSDLLFSSPAATSALWSPSFVSPSLLLQAAALFPGAGEPRGPDVVQREGPRWEIVIAPGAIQLRTRDEAKAARSRERSVECHRRDTDQLASQLTRDGSIPPQPPCRQITGWSRRSRARMTHRLCELDYSALFTDPTQLPAMLTLTYPGDWLTVAPCGRSVKRHLRILRQRYQRAWDQDLACVWKLEFQRRGAPHVHLLIRPPTGTVGGQPFREWISSTWAEVVAHPDPEQHARHRLAGTGLDYNHGLRSRDPKRVAVYFTKHGCLASKNYQHHVPEPWQHPDHGPGRFWGYWGLKPARAITRLHPTHAIRAGRTLRRWSHATHRRRTRRLRHNRGWVSCPNGAALATQLARYLLIAQRQ